MFEWKATDSGLENGNPDHTSGKVCQDCLNPQIHSSSMGNPVSQAAYARDVDGDVISHREREVIRRNDSCSRQKNDAVGKTSLTAKPVDQIGKSPCHSAEAGSAFKYIHALALDCEMNRDFIQGRH